MFEIYQEHLVWEITTGEKSSRFYFEALIY